MESLHVEHAVRCKRTSCGPVPEGMSDGIPEGFWGDSVGIPGGFRGIPGGVTGIPGDSTW